MVSGEQHVILPSTSLFLVDRSWRTNSKSSKLHLNWQNDAEKSKSVILRNETGITVIKSTHHARTSLQGQNTEQQGGRRQGCISEMGRAFKFINATKLNHTRDPSVQRLVKSHVKKGIPRHRGVQKSPKSRSTRGCKTTEYVENGEATTSLPLRLGTVCSGSASPFYGNKANVVLSGSRSQSLLSYYLEVVALSWYPLEHHLAYSPVKAGWLPLALTDELLYRSVLFSSASRLAVEDGQPDLDEPKILVKPIFGQLSQRLKNYTELSDSTIAIVACLAMVEISFGNYERWKLHMIAIKEMVRLRGGLQSIDMSLQTKICRADIEGATDCLSPPYLSPLPHYTTPTSSSFPLLSEDKLKNPSVSLLKALHICPRLHAMLHTLSQLSHAIDNALCHSATTPLNPRAIDEDFSLLLHQLLLWQPSRPSSLNEALQLGALLYAKSITRLAPAHKRPVVQRFISALDAAVEEQEDTLPLRMWLFLVGAVAVRNDSKERAWFVAGLGSLRQTDSDEKLATWDSVRWMLQEMPWVSLIHEALWKELWEETETMMQLDKTGTSRASGELDTSR